MDLMALIDMQWYARRLPHDPGRCDGAQLLKYTRLIFTPKNVTDVVKTRLQVEARKGQTTYKGLADAFAKICKQKSDSSSWMHLD